MRTTIVSVYATSGHGIAAHMSDGSVFYINGLGCGESNGDITFAPDSWHYPEPGDGRGKRSSGPFECHTPEHEKF